MVSEAHTTVLLAGLDGDDNWALLHILIDIQALPICICPTKRLGSGSTEDGVVMLPQAALNLEDPNVYIPAKTAGSDRERGMGLFCRLLDQITSVASDPCTYDEH